MSQPAAKLSVRVPRELAAEIRRRVGARGLSGFVARAIAHELERDALIDEIDRQLGPVSSKALASARRAWPKR